MFRCHGRQCRPPIWTSSLCRRASNHATPAVAVVGTGPAGFYASKYLLKELPNARIDLIDRLPTPFGLVRSGVAPDHPEVKAVQHDFVRIAEDNRVSFWGNVNVGQDISVDKLRQIYDIVILAYGASEDRRLGIPGEDIKGVLSARTFVNWYNGHPDCAGDERLNNHLRSILSQDHCNVVIIGQGNVALDCARILAKRPEALKETDICQHALEVLSRSRVKSISVVGRRGHGQAAFTIKELRELSRIEGTQLAVDPRELELGLTESTKAELSTVRARKRLADLVHSLPSLTDMASRERNIGLRFLLMPRAIEAAQEPDAVGGMQFERTKLEGPPGKVVAKPAGERVHIPCQLILRSIGYQSLPLPGVPFDTRRVALSHQSGRLYDGFRQLVGLYCTGWVKRGPSGIINTNIIDARETTAAILEDIRKAVLPYTTAAEGDHSGTGRRSSEHLNVAAERRRSSTEGLIDYLVRKGVKRRSEVVTWEGYRRIDDWEVKAGRKKGKPREKVIDVDQLLRIANEEQVR